MPDKLVHDREERAPVNPAEALRLAVKVTGSQAAMARLLGVAQPSVWRWLHGQELPAEHVLAVETATGISRHELRPDIYPIEPATPARDGRDLGAMEPAR